MIRAVLSELSRVLVVSQREVAERRFICPLQTTCPGFPRFSDESPLFNLRRGIIRMVGGVHSDPIFIFVSSAAAAPL